MEVNMIDPITLWAKFKADGAHRSALLKIKLLEVIAADRCQRRAIPAPAKRIYSPF
jgi:hypothetical protein